jgi:hypothetical protein
MNKSEPATNRGAHCEFMFRLVLAGMGALRHLAHRGVIELGPGLPCHTHRVPQRPAAQNRPHLARNRQSHAHLASMRPGHYRPGKLPSAATASQHSRRFNEARALPPPVHPNCTVWGAFLHWADAFSESWRDPTRDRFAVCSAWIKLRAIEAATSGGA